jgi:hypothetical protein
MFHVTVVIFIFDSLPLKGTFQVPAVGILFRTPVSSQQFFFFELGRWFRTLLGHPGKTYTIIFLFMDIGG